MSPTNLRNAAALRYLALGASATIGSSVLYEKSTDDRLQRVARCETRADKPKLAFLGSGSSTGCPVGVCTMSMKTQPSARFPFCKVSKLASRGNPKENKDYRNNPSFLIHHYQPETDSYKNIVIDVGKTFREGALRWFHDLGVESLDAIVLTHEHMDAAAGLDDVRGFQRYYPDHLPGQRPHRVPVPVYLSQHCHGKVQSQFPWLFPRPDDPPTTMVGGKPVVKRDVAGLVPTIFEDFKTLNVEGVPITPLPVWHGEDLIAHGFAIQVRSKTGRITNVLYLSDISRMPSETMAFIQEKLPPVDILIVDALLPGRKHSTHFCLEDAIALKQQLMPKLHTYLIGMSCESYPPHDEYSRHLKEMFGDVSMSYDGLVIELE